MTGFVVTIGVLGAIVGSFVGVVAERVPAGASLGGRSRCAACGHVLGPFELVPVLGWLALRGRCRHCAAAIGWEHPAIELLAAALFAGLALHLGRSAELVPYLLLVAGLLALSLVDLRTLRLPDRIVAPVTIVVVAAFGAAALIDDDGGRLLRALAAGAASTLILGLLHLGFPAGMGFGDVKLAFVLGVATGWVSWGAPAIALFLAALTGAVTGVVIARVERGPIRGRRVPFGPFLAVGALAAVFLAPTIADAWSRLGTA